MVAFTPPRVGVYELHVVADGLPLDASPLRVDVIKQSGRISATVRTESPPVMARAEPCNECGRRAQHLASCSQYLETCGECGERVRRVELQRHAAVWCSSRRVSCGVCASVLRVGDYAGHIGLHVAAFKAKTVVENPATHFGVFICENFTGGARVASVRRGQPAQLLVDERQKLRRGVGVALLDGGEDLCDVEYTESATQKTPR